MKAGFYMIKHYLYGAIPLDEYHVAVPCCDKDNNLTWQLITTSAQIVDGEIDAVAGFTMTEIDPGKFEWNGKRILLESNK